MTWPQLASLHIYPVKSVGGPAPDEAAVEPWGLAGDRRWMLVDTSGRFVTQRQQPRLALLHAVPLAGAVLRVGAPGREPLTVAPPEAADSMVVAMFRDTVRAVSAGPEAAAWFSEVLGVDMRLVYLDDPRRRQIDPDYARPGETVSFADGYPLLLTTTASLGAFNALLAEGEHAAEGPLPMDRFRPNVVVAGTEPWAEDHWRRVRIGEVDFRIAKPCGRCAVPTTDQRTGQRGKEPLWTLARHRRFGTRLVFGQNLIPETLGTLRLGDPFSVLD